MKESFIRYKILALLSVIFTATQPALAKFALGYNSPIIIILVTQLASGMILMMLFGIIPEIKKYISFKKLDGFLLLVALLSGALGPMLSMIGLIQSSVLNSVLIASFGTPITALLSHIFLKEKVDIAYFIGLFLLAFGITLYSTQFFQTGLSFSWNDLYFVGGVVAYALGDVLYKKKLAHVSNELVLISRNFFGSIFLLLALLIFAFERDLYFTPDSSTFLSMGLIVLMPILFAQALWYTSLEKLQATEASFITAMYPLFAALIAFFFLQEGIEWYQIGGGLIMVLGLIISRFHFQRHRLQKDELKLQGFKNY